MVFKRMFVVQCHPNATATKLYVLNLTERSSGEYKNDMQPGKINEWIYREIEEAKGAAAAANMQHTSPL